MFPRDLSPGSSQGVASGDISGGGRAVIWSRSDRPARMIVEYATNSFLKSFTFSRVDA
ncbi:hypothetical protein [Okeania sp. SIO2B3]|uniref:hypothetical protein n=1 Tax=Okeania sp. SIO2B3 TaxID=2607784 RepID=UPI0013C081D2|nr:hypothetical protein [Okeania sp. SIO2B3]NET41534.1 hypothetical protein [Okeania sp. SIO2B3]